MRDEKLQAAIERMAELSAIERMAELSDKEQAQLAAQIEAWLPDRTWDALLEDPHGDAVVAELMREAQDSSFYPWPGK